MTRRKSRTAPGRPRRGPLLRAVGTVTPPGTEQTISRRQASLATAADSGLRFAAKQTQDAPTRTDSAALININYTRAFVLQ